MTEYSQPTIKIVKDHFGNDTTLYEGSVEDGNVNNNNDSLVKNATLAVRDALVALEEVLEVHPEYEVRLDIVDSPTRCSDDVLHWQTTVLRHPISPIITVNRYVGRHMPDD